MSKHYTPSACGTPGARSTPSAHRCAIEYYAPLAVYDDNYERLMTLLPTLQQVSPKHRLALMGCDGFGFELLEKTPYTSVVRLTADWSVCAKLVPAPELTVRLYHDAAVAEVITYQSRGRFKVEYDYPNPNMFNKREKRRLNEFLSAWLGVCLLRLWKEKEHDYSS
ncbi:MAG: hypothetical protein COC09_04430 [Gammaproteobacteria bacterium]|nr:DUF1249 domain-containing protein [Gammaproteobacteria bacterium]PCH63942.1 MAG: hypothetical protein COC09_04430 [Gammaproteobacteria bacterium]